mgnify:CR=1 FL=1
MLSISIPQAFAACKKDKVVYPTEDCVQAKIFIRTARCPGIKLYYYWCDECVGFHITKNKDICKDIQAFITTCFFYTQSGYSRFNYCLSVEVFWFLYCLWG